MGVRDGGPHLGATVLEHEHVVDVVPGAELDRPLRPQGHQPCHVRRREGPERGVVDRRVEHHLGPTAGQRWEAVGEPAHLVGLRRLEAAGAERAVVDRQVGPGLAGPDDDGALTGEAVDAGDQDLFCGVGAHDESR